MRTNIEIDNQFMDEVLQGSKHDKDYRAARSVFDDMTIFTLLGRPMAIKSAENFRALRKKGITVRKTADVNIATFCIEQDTPLLFFQTGTSSPSSATSA